MSVRTFLASLGIAVILASIAGPARAELVGYWAFDGDTAAGGVADDQSAFANDGAFTSGSVTFSGDVAAQLGGGQSAGFSGASSSNLVSVANTPSLEGINDALTIAFWVKGEAAAQSPTWARIIRKGTEGNGSQSWLVGQAYGNSDILIRTDTAGSGGAYNQNRHIGTGTGVLDGDWHHIAYMLDAGSTKEYVDGVLTSTSTYPHGLGLSNTQALLIGGRPGNMFTGQLDEVAVWDQVIPEASIAALAAGATNPLDAAVPEPSTLAMLLGLGGIGLLGYLRRRRRN